MRPISQLNSHKLLSTVKSFFSSTGLFEISSGIKGSISKEQFCLHFKMTSTVLDWTPRASHWDSAVNADMGKEEEEMQVKCLIIPLRSIGDISLTLLWVCTNIQIFEATNLHDIDLFSPTIPDFKFPMISFHVLSYSNCIHLQKNQKN